MVQAWLLALLPSLALSILLQLAAPGAEQPEFRVDGRLLPVTIVALVVVGPLLETLLMIAPLLALERLFGAGPAVVASALLWGAAHSLLVPTWGLVVWWPFLILSIAFLTWRGRGIGTAILVVMLVHALHNSVPAAALAIAGMAG